MLHVVVVRQDNLIESEREKDEEAGESGSDLSGRTRPSVSNWKSLSIVIGDCVTETGTTGSVKVRTALAGEEWN